MALDPTTRPSRRTLLAGALGGLAGLVATALGRVAPADAANGQAVTVGNSFQGTSPTAITNSAGDGIIAGNTWTAGSGLFAHATATSGPTYGVFGRSNSASGTGVAGVNYGASGTTRGVYGQASSSSGYGVDGYAPAGTGVRGKSDTGVGIRGEATSGVAVRAFAPSPSATALWVSGRTVFSRSARVSIPANKSYVDILPAGGLASGANILALLQASRPGVWVRAVRINYPSSGNARIYLNKVASTTLTTPVAFFVIG
jgi:hypothetical protein